MVSYTNFFETIQEAEMRLKNSIVKYRDDFYYVEAVSDAKADGKFRVYMDQLGHGGHGQDRLAGFGYPNSYDFYGDEFSKALDKWLEENPDKGFARKYASSRHFNKFRPFPLGNVNVDGAVVYCERGPTRNMHQGLREPAVLSTNVSTVPVRYDPNSRARSSSYRSQVQPIGNSRMDIFSREFYNMLKGDYPSFQEVVENLLDPEVLNYGCAFHREYSVMRGPLGFLFLCHRHSGAGLIDSDLNLILGGEQEFLVEELTEMKLFKTITVKKGSDSNNA